MKDHECVYGFVDESGAPGISATDNDFLIVSVTLFKNQNIIKSADEKLDNLRKELKLPKSYEFHSSRNIPLVRKAVFKTLAGIDFEFITFALKKDLIKRHASYIVLAETLIRELATTYQTKFEIKIDTNPNLLKEFNKTKKMLHFEKKFYFKQVDSKNNNLIQLTDYVVNSHSKIIRGNAKEKQNFRFIEKKLVKLVEK